MGDDLKLQLYMALSKYAGNGVNLYVQDVPVTPFKAVQQVMEGSGNYMADFIHNFDGQLTEIRYDKVEAWK